MKMVYCIPSLYNPGGMERVLTEKINYFSEVLGYEITVITTEQKGRNTYFKLPSAVKIVDFDLNFNEHFGKSFFSKLVCHYKKMLRYKKMLSEYLVKNEIDICISLCGKEIDFLTTLKDQSIKIAEIHFSMNNRKLFIMARHQGLFWKIVGDIRTRQLLRATSKLKYLVVLTEQDAMSWRKTHKNIVVIPNPAPFSCEELNRMNAKTVISVGKLDEQKGYDYLLEAWVDVFKKHKDWTLKIFGQGEWKGKLQDFINRNGMENAVKLCGLTQNVKLEYLNSSFYAMSSRYEGLPMVLIEAMTCGLPVVAFDCECGPKEIIKDGENGFLVPLPDTMMLGNMINRLIDDEDLRMKMSKKARKESLKFDKLVIMKQWETILMDNCK